MIMQSAENSQVFAAIERGLIAVREVEDRMAQMEDEARALRLRISNDEIRMGRMHSLLVEMRDAVRLMEEDKPVPMVWLRDRLDDYLKGKD